MKRVFQAKGSQSPRDEEEHGVLGLGVGVELCTHPAPPLGTPEPFLPLALDPNGSWLCTVPFIQPIPASPSLAG